MILRCCCLLSDEKIMRAFDFTAAASKGDPEMRISISISTSTSPPPSLLHPPLCLMSSSAAHCLHRPNSGLSLLAVCLLLSMHGLSPHVAMELSNVPKSLEYTVLKWDMASSYKGETPMVWDCQGDEAFSYLDAVDRLQSLMTSLSVSRPALEHAHSLIQQEMAQLEEEFRCLLIAHSDSVDPEWIFEQILGPRSGEEEDAASQGYGEEGEGRNEGEEEISVAEAVPDFNFTIDLIPLDVVSDLNNIAGRMMAGGYAKECCQVYASIRKAVLDHSLSRLGVEKISMDDVQKMVWENLEVRIKKWNQALKVAVRVLYASEKILCDQVFAGLSPWGETSFVEVAKSSIVQLISFAEAIAISRRSPEKLFKILDMYETLCDILPDINSIFSDDLCIRVRSEAKGTLMRLGEAVRGIFAEFENAIRRESSKIPVPGGGIHPLTRYVMNYIWLLFCYIVPLKRLLGDKKKATPILPGPENNGSMHHSHEDDCNNCADHLSPLGVQIVWLTVLLECNLDGKSKLYKEMAQTHLFLMNNVHYIVQKVKKSELASLVGDDWVRKQSDQVRLYATNYVRAAWKKVLAFLRDEGLHVSSTFFSGVSKVALKDRLKGFNCSFEELHRIQSTWVVPDPELREELRISIAERIIPAYRSFLTRYQSYLGSGRQRERYIRYTPEDLEKCLLDLFEGMPFTAATRRKSFSTS